MDWIRDHWEATVVTLVKENAGLDQRGDDQGWEGIRLWIYFQLLDFTNGLNVGSEGLS